MMVESVAEKARLLFGNMLGPEWKFYEHMDAEGRRLNISRTVIIKDVTTQGVANAVADCFKDQPHYLNLLAKLKKLEEGICHLRVENKALKEASKTIRISFQEEEKDT